MKKKTLLKCRQAITLRGKSDSINHNAMIITMKVKVIKYHDFVKHKNVLVWRQGVPVKGENSLTQISQADHPENISNSWSWLPWRCFQEVEHPWLIKQFCMTKIPGSTGRYLWTSPFGMFSFLPGAQQAKKNLVRSNIKLSKTQINLEDLLGGNLITL